MSVSQSKDITCILSAAMYKTGGKDRAGGTMNVANEYAVLDNIVVCSTRCFVCRAAFEFLLGNAVGE